MFLTPGSRVTKQSSWIQRAMRWTAAQRTKARSNLGAAGTVAPQGRLTLQTGVPVMTVTQSAKTTLFYTPYVGDQIPIYDGTSMVPTPFTELSATTSDTTKSPTAIGVSKVNDWFVWNDNGTIRLSHGPDWTSDTVRLDNFTYVNGIIVNNVAITNGPALQRGTYVGSTRSNGSSQLDWILGGSASGGTAGFLGVWNCHNRVWSMGQAVDNGAAYTYTSATVRQARASSGMQVSYIVGISEDAAIATCGTEIVTAAVLNASGTSAIGIDSTTAFGTTRFLAAALAGAGQVVASGSIAHQFIPTVGFKVVTLLESSNGTNACTFNNISTANVGLGTRM